MKGLLFCVILTVCVTDSQTCTCQYTGPDVNDPSQAAAVCTASKSFVDCLQASMDPGCADMLSTVQQSFADLKCAAERTCLSTSLLVVLAVWSLMSH